MRKLTFLFAIILTAVGLANGQSDTAYDIRVEVSGLEDSVAYLGYHFGEKRYYQDTSRVDENGAARFTGNTPLKKGVYFLYAKGYYLEFLVKEQKFSLKTSTREPYKNMVIEGSPENEAFRDFQLIMKEHQQAMRKLNTDLKNAATKDDSTALYALAGKLVEKNKTQRDSLKKHHSDKYTAVLLRLMEQSEMSYSDDDTMEEKRRKYNAYKARYFDGIDFDDEGTLRVPIFHAKVMEYMEKVTFQNPDSVLASVEYILDKSKNNEEMFRYWMVYFFKKYQSSKIMGMDKVFVHLSEKYYLQGKAPWVDEEMLEKLREEMDFHRENQIGMQAPALYLVDTLLDQQRLQMIDADYTVLFFYSPECGHCKKSTPVLLDVYHNLKPEGVEIVGVNVDTDIEKWKAFVQEYQLDWINLADPFTRSNFRRQYNVRSTPTIYILDKDKRIIAKKLGVEQIEGFVRDRMQMDAASQ